MTEDRLYAALNRLYAVGGGIIGIDGMAAGGKTTLARALAERYGASLFHADDYFLPPELRTKERLTQPGGNMDRERLLKEVLEPLSRCDSVRMRAYNCKENRLLSPVEVPFRSMSIIEGAYCLHPELASFYSLCVFVRTSEKAQRKRLLLREGEEGILRFNELWLPLEEEYFEAFKPYENSLIMET